MASITRGSALRNIPPGTDRIDQLFDTIGDGTGTTEMAAAAARYYFRPPADRVAIVVRINTLIKTAARIDPDEYGDQTALTNGIKIYHAGSSGNILHDFTPNPITVNESWGLLVGADVIPAANQAGDDYVLVRWTLEKAGYHYIVNGANGEYLMVDVRDTLVNLSNHIMHLQGYWAR